MPETVNTAGGVTAPGPGWSDAAALWALMDSVGTAVLVVAGARITGLNASAQSLLGSDAGRWIGQPLSVLAPPDTDHPWRRSGWLDALPAGQAVRFDAALQRADGSLLRVSGHAWADPAAQAPARAVVLALSDMEQHRLAERRTARAQASLQRVIETAPLAIAVFEMPSRRVLQANQAAESFFGLPLARLVGASPRQWPPGGSTQDLGALEASLDLAMESPPGVRREIVDSGREGSAARAWDTRFVSIAPDGAQGPAGEAAQVLLVANEVTDLRAAEQERFDAAIAQRGMLVQEVHHRIKNNLQGVAGLLQQASTRYPEVAPILAEAVGQLQAIAQVYGLQVGSGGPVQLAGLLQAVAQSVQRTFSRAIDFAVQGDEPARWRLPEAEAIPVALTANELLTNALKHGGDQPVRCTLLADVGAVTIEILNRGQLREGFDLRSRTGSASGLGLVRALLPRRSAELALSQDGPHVLTRVVLRPPAVRRDG
jgi:two-component sensor histidine kinase